MGCPYYIGWGTVLVNNYYELIFYLYLNCCHLGICMVIVTNIKYICMSSLFPLELYKYTVILLQYCCNLRVDSYATNHYYIILKLDYNNIKFWQLFRDVYFITLLLVETKTVPAILRYTSKFKTCNVIAIQWVYNSCCWLYNISEVVSLAQSLVVYSYLVHYLCLELFLPQCTKKFNL